MSGVFLADLFLVAGVAVVAFMAGYLVRAYLARWEPRATGETLDFTGARPRLRVVDGGRPQLGPGERLNPKTGQVEYSSAWLSDVPAPPVDLGIGERARGGDDPR